MDRQIKEFPAYREHLLIIIGLRIGNWARLQKGI